MTRPHLDQHRRDVGMASDDRVVGRRGAPRAAGVAVAAGLDQHLGHGGAIEVGGHVEECVALGVGLGRQVELDLLPRGRFDQLGRHLLPPLERWVGGVGHRGGERRPQAAGAKG